MKEKWIQINKIQGYEDVRDCYWLSNSDEDKIINRSTGKRLKIGINHGYPVATLYIKDGRMRNYKIHILKAKAFLFGPNLLVYNVIRHLNDIKTDNRLENLFFGTQSQNVRDCVRNGNYNYEAAAKAAAKGSAKGYAKSCAIIIKKLSKPVKCIESGMIYPSASEASRQLGIPRINISANCRGIYETAGGFHWEFVDQKENEN